MAATQLARWDRMLPSFVPRGGSLPPAVWERRHVGILWLLWAHATVIPIFALIRGKSPAHIVVEGAVVPVIAAVATWAPIGRRARTAAASLGLLMSSAVLVHLSGGVIEMHFHFFVMVAAVALYQDWLPFLTAIAFVFLHHGIVGVIDANGVYNHAAAWRAPWTWAGIHAFFIFGISAMCLVTWGTSERTLAQRKKAEDDLRAETHVVETLNAVGHSLAAELDTQTVVQTVTDAATQVTGAGFGAFFYNVINENGEAYLLYTLSGAPVEAFSRFGIPRNTAIFAPTFAGEGVVRLDDVTADRRYGHNAPHHGMPEGHLPVRSYLAVPVKSRRGEVLGGLFFGHPDAGQFTADHERIVVGIAAQAAVAIDNARLYESERAARAAAETARDKLTMLTDASRALTSSLELAVILRDLAEVVTNSLADGCEIHLVDEGGDVSRVAGAGVSPESSGVEAALTRALAAGPARFVPAADAGVGGPAAVVTPLIGRHRVLGALTIATTGASDRSLTEGDIPIVEELARRAAVAIENAQLFQRQRTVAETLQHSLLPDRLPDIPGVEAAMRYLPGADVEVGGDWYDVIRLPRGDLAISMGDVVGRGERAASLMGQIRNAVRAYALDGKSPVGIATATNALLLASGADHMATMVYAVIDAEAGELRFVNAGHPPPLTVDPDGLTTFVQPSVGLPLGASPAATYQEICCSFPPGSTVVLYTDGLVEDRRESLQVGLDRLRTAVAYGPTDVEDLCAHVLAEAMADRNAQDDTALLILRLQPLGPTLALQLEADPSTLTALRATLRRWLAEAGANDQEMYELLVAAGEACSNAIRHATGPGSGTFDLEATADDSGQIAITVRDYGRWRSRPSGEGGRGLGIMEGFVDHLEVSRGGDGTEIRMQRRLIRSNEPVSRP